MASGALEAGTGIEPVMEDLQSSALPLGHPAGERAEGSGATPAGATRPELGNAPTT
jgi:hypothetical protein